ncbi:retrovirus-related Pol polyprotein from transposon opus [Trichonephila clavata]|uniref:Retrovirus-related Pol polyprotein from transposon opus n=1 Tax=Trichonephila clavata TaxID=2740835 RepID=A0A8X6F7T6_TRICU|nr:retrovirus-related Pol polyprotein from transposon opus [Trichonephila clavata]
MHNFLAIINFYHCFIAEAAQKQALLYDSVKTNKKNDKTPIQCKLDAIAAFDICKNKGANAALLACPKDDAPFSLLTDASDIAIGVFLNQHADDGLQPLALFSHKSTPTEKNYGIYD